MYFIVLAYEMILKEVLGLSPWMIKVSPSNGIWMIFSSQIILARCLDNQSIPMMTSKLPNWMGMRLIGKDLFRRVKVQFSIRVLVLRIFPSANSIS